MSYGFLYPEGVLDMAIKINTEKRIFTLETKHTMYQMQADTYGVLRHLWYGAKTGCDMSYLQDYPDVGFSGNPHDAGNDRTYSLDTLPLEYAGAGIGDFRVPAVEAVHADGSCALDLRYYSHTVKQGKYAIAGLPALYAGEDEAETLEVVLRDTASAVEVTLKYGVLPELDVVTRCAEIRNLGEAPVTLTKAASLCLDMGQGSWEWIHFYGRHAMERQAERRPLLHGIQESSSTRGTSSHHQNPTVLLCTPDCTETSGACVGAALVYSGSSVTATNASGSVVSNPSNLTISGANVTVTASGELSVSGESTSGQLAVNVDKTAEPEGKVVLNLEGLTLSNDSVAPIYVEAIGDEVQISAKNGTTNTISDGTSHTDTYVDSDGNTNPVNGAIFSRDDLKLKGKGTLIVNGNTEDGIVCKNDLKIWNGSITVNAADDGIRGNDSVRIGDPDATDYSTLSVTVNTNNGSTGGDGIKSNSTETDKGYITINGGTVNINSYADGIQAEQTFTMNGGDLNITTYQGSDFSGNASGGWGGGMGGDGNSSKTDISAKGIKAVGLYDEAGTTWQSGGNLIVNGGTITIDSSDDSLHCGGDMQLLGGSMTLATADDGAHSDHALIIGSTGGDDDSPYVNITKSYEGIEGVDITQNSGTVMVTSSDDGYNAAGGSDSSGNHNNGGWGQGGWGGPGGGNSSNGSQTMTFNGGYTYVNAAGDGLDSNGNISFNGGYVFVSQTGGGNGPLDCGDSNNSITYSGGTVIAAGSSDMFETPSSYSFLSQTSVSAGQTITFTDASGNVLATFTLPNGSAEMVMSSKESSVTCYTGGTLSGTTYFASQDDTDRCGYGGTISGGTTVSASSGGNGGWGGGGNNRPF